MRHWLVYIFSIACLTVLLCGVFWVYQPLFLPFSSALSFPIPISFALPSNKEVVTLDLWLPNKTIPQTIDRKAPQLSAQSAIVFDVGSNTLLFAKNATTELPMASLTKIMTAVIALEHPKSDDVYTVRPQALVGEDSMGLEAGETLSLKELLYGLILHSGNDAAEVLADNYSGGRSAFITAMNDKVAALGLSHTHFTNPTGLEGDGKQYTTSYDLLVLTNYALSHFPLFDEVAATFDYTIPPTPTHKVYYLENETNLLTSYPGVQGVKTGYTPEAGLCLVTYLDYGGHHVIAVILNSGDRRDDMKDLLDYSLKKLGVTPPHHG